MIKPAEALAAAAPRQAGGVRAGQAWGAVAALGTLRLVYWLAAPPNSDEAYYWLWGRHPAALAVVITRDARLRHLWRDPRLWLAAGLALAAVSPVLLWNGARGGASFRFHLVERADPGGSRPLASPAGAGSPERRPATCRRARC